LGISSKNQWDNKPKKEDFITYGKSCDDDDDESHPNHRVDSVELNSSAMQVGSFFFFLLWGIWTNLSALRLFLTVHWASCKLNEQIRHHGSDKHTHKKLNSRREQNKSHNYHLPRPSIASGQFNTIHERTLSRLFHRKRQQLIKSICYYSNNNHKVISLSLANKVEIV